MITSDLLSTARALRDNALRPSRLNPLIFMTDPARIKDPIALIVSLPQSVNGHMAIIFRHFGAQNRLETAHKLRLLSFARNMQLLIGNDAELASACGADGVHFTRKTDPQIITQWKRRCPDWILSQAGQKGPLVDNDLNLAQLDGLLISSVFKSTSPSAGSPMGVSDFSALCQKLEVPVFALGGITDKTAPALIGSGAAGLAAILGIKDLAG